jgi:hypothetical protein
LLLNGKVLVAAGAVGGGDTATAELYDLSLGFDSAWQPAIDTATSSRNHRIQLAGSGFQGISQASGGNTQDSSTNYPIVQLRSIDNSQVVYLFVNPLFDWSDTSFNSLPARGFVPGPTRATVFTNGIPSEAKYLVVPQ